MQNFLVLSSRVILAAALLSPLRISGQAAQAPQEDVLTHPANIGDAPLPIFAAFQTALQTSGVPGGVAFIEGCSDRPLPIARAHGITLREVLDSIIAGDSAYTWKLTEGVVNIQPSTGPPALLRAHLNNYESGDASDAVSAVTFLSSSPGVASAATQLGLVQNVLGPGLGSMMREPTPPKKPLGIRLHDVTFVDALNAIARANQHGVWVYRETHCGPVQQFNVSFAQ
jgi:hypothetical protein